MIHRQQDANIEKLQDTVAAQAEQIAANKAAQDEQKDLTDAKFAELYKALSALGQPLTKTEDPDPNRKCAPGSASPDTAIEVSGAGADRVLSLSVCDGKVELNSEQCTVDPCDLQQYIQVLQSRLATLTDI